MRHNKEESHKNHFKSATDNGLISDKAFWDLVKPFLSNKGVLVGSEISVVKGNKIVTDDRELTELLNKYYVNIIKKTSGKKPCSVADTTDVDIDRDIVKLILEKYNNLQSVLAILQSPDYNLEIFLVNEIEPRDVAILLKNLDRKNPQGKINTPETCAPSCE